MAMTYEEFVQSLSDCGLMGADEVEAFLYSLPLDDRPRTAESLAKEMYRQGKLTRFQTQAVYQRKTFGLVIGNYVVLDRLGKSEVGLVYRAQHRRLKRVVAVTLLPPEAAKSQERVKLFQRQVELIGKLSHPNIVMAYDADEYRGVHLLVMEYVEGRNLYTLVKENGSLPVAMAVDYILQAAKGLDYAHRQGVIDGHIDPSKLLLDLNGTVKVRDMGLARTREELVGPDADEENASQGDEVMSRADFMSPEQRLETRSVDTRSDIYSLGCTLYYLLVGRAISRGATLEEVPAHRDEPVPSLLKARNDAPPQLEEVFQRMVANRPADRYQTMNEVILELAKCCAGTA